MVTSMKDFLIFLNTLYFYQNLYWNLRIFFSWDHVFNVTIQIVFKKFYRFIEVKLFKTYNLMRFDIYIYQWNHHYCQEDEQINKFSSKTVSSSQEEVQLSNCNMYSYAGRILCGQESVAPQSPEMGRCETQSPTLGHGNWWLVEPLLLPRFGSRALYPSYWVCTTIQGPLIF